MKQIIFIFFIFIGFSTNAQLSTTDIANGLKEALNKGITKAADSLSKVDGYFKNPKIKIPFPPDAQKMERKLRSIGLGEDVDHFILTLNRGAEDAAMQAKPIFIDALKKMTITDAVAILKGRPDAATQYLQKTTTAQLKTQFQPIIKASLDKVNATKYYSRLANEYDKIPFVKKVNPNLAAYTTDLAIKGLFVKIAEEEKNIRANPAAQTTSLLKKVFGSITKK
ncbi:MAG: DUF4197 domain-containing protein [Bacteroidetes bacterium]|nr:DUF4197 domain-containing protein [Bacteroidota bacterium]